MWTLYQHLFLLFWTCVCTMVIPGKWVSSSGSEVPCPCTISLLRQQYLFLGKALEEHKLCVQVSRQFTYWIKITRLFPKTLIFLNSGVSFLPVVSHFTIYEKENLSFRTQPVLSSQGCHPGSGGGRPGLGAQLGSDGHPPLCFSLRWFTLSFSGQLK